MPTSTLHPQPSTIFLLSLAYVPFFLLLALALALLSSGCVIARVPTPCGAAYVGSLFKAPEIPKVEILSSNGATWKLEGYKGAVDAAALGEIIGAAAKTMVTK